MTSMLESCCHTDNLVFSPSSYASIAGYIRPTEQQRASATTATSSSRGSDAKSIAGAPAGHSISSTVSSSTFPAPLVLPGDELACDPKYPAQSVRSWTKDKDRNPVTTDRRTIYVIGPPKYAEDFPTQWKEWTTARTSRFPDVVHIPGQKKRRIDQLRESSDSIAGPSEPIPSEPEVSDIVEYLSAFYHGMEVKTLPVDSLTFTIWEEGSAKGKRKFTTPKHIGLQTSKEWFGIGARTRTPPSNPNSCSIFPAQLNLNHLLDAVISILPDYEDAYAIIMLVSHDIYEDDDDDFACGRAYGGSRVAVISMARYNPALDKMQNLDRTHAWPASHCVDFITKACGQSENGNRSVRKRRKEENNQVAVDSELMELDSLPESHLTCTPMHSALAAIAPNPHDPNSDRLSPAQMNGLWLSRTCITSSHELGHCFGIDHCVYYACVMQGTAGLAEDARQPPYLCPIDSAKISSAIAGVTRMNGNEYLIARDRALLKFCEAKSRQEVRLFKAFGAWLKAKLGYAEDNEKGKVREAVDDEKNLGIVEISD